MHDDPVPFEARAVHTQSIQNALAAPTANFVWDIEDKSYEATAGAQLCSPGSVPTQNGPSNDAPSAPLMSPGHLSYENQKKSSERMPLVPCAVDIQC